MRIMAFGKRMSGDLLFAPMDEQQFARELAGNLAQNALAVQTRAAAATRGLAFRGEVERVGQDPGDPHAVGWAFLVAKDDPQRDQIIEVLKPLAQHRGMEDPATPLVFSGEPEDDWGEWLDESYYGLETRGKRVPRYVLLVGGPDRLPFRLQSLLDSTAFVGRLDFDSLDDLQQYVAKVIRLEAAPDPVVKREAVLFAPDGGPKDPTYFSREYMVAPLDEYIRQDLHFRTTALMADEATKQRLQNALRGAQPALVYTASHGLLMEGTLEQEMKYNGAICCQHLGPLGLDKLFTADDVPMDEPFLEGSLFFQFACYGYGTPAESDYAHWLSELPEKCADADFVAALPKRLLAHPRGPIAFVGHLDTAFLHGFADPDDPEIAARWHARIQPFLHAVVQLLGVQPSALAMEDMNGRYATSNARLTRYYDQMRRGTLEWTDASRKRFVDTWIFRSDAQNYMVFGDPAARLRIPDA